MSQMSKGRKITIGDGQLEALRILNAGELPYEELLRRLQGSGYYSSKQQAIRGVEVFIRAQIIEVKDNGNVVRLSVLGRRFLEGLEALFRE